MLTLCLDTAYRYLTCALIEDDKIIAKKSAECFKRQSEEVFHFLDILLAESNRRLLDIDAVCISKGPGSYTGVRIAMTIAKVICSLKGLKLYTISTLRLYAANDPMTMVLMDARAHRAYIGIYDKERVLLKDCAKDLACITKGDYRIVGDGHLIGEEDQMPDIAEAFLKTRHFWEEERDIDHLTPLYLKESDAYYR